MRYPSATIASGLGARLAQLRAMKGLSQADIVQGELSRAYVSAVERGRITPSLQALELIAARLGEPVSVLLGEAATSAQGVMPVPAVLELERALFALVTRPDSAPDLAETEQTGELGLDGSLLALYVAARRKLAADQLDAAICTAREGISQTQGARRMGRELWQMWFEVLLGTAYVRAGQAASAADLLADVLARLTGEGSVDAFEAARPTDATLELAARAAQLTALDRLGQVERLTPGESDLEAMLPRSLVDAATTFFLAGPGTPSSGQGQSGPWSPRLLLAKLVEHMRAGATLWQGLAVLAQRRSDRALAEARLGHAVDLAEMAGDWEQASRALSQLAELQLDAGELDAAAESVRRGAGLAERQNSDWVRGLATSIAAKVAAARGQPDEALRLFRDAIECLERAGRKGGKELSEAYFGYGRLLVSQGRVDEGVKLLERAYVATQNGGGWG